MEIKTAFEGIEDPRRKNSVDYPLSDILTLVMGAVVCRVTELEDMMSYFENSAEFYKENFNIEAIASKSTFSRVLNILNPDTVKDVMIEIMKKHTKEIGDIIAFDGKTVRGTVDVNNPHSFLQILSAYATESGVILAQQPINTDDKTNEIPVVQEMLKDLNIRGKTVTADAMHCQKETCEAIIDAGANYVIGLKNNQKNFYQDVELFFQDPFYQKQMMTFETLEKNGGRVEKRTINVTENIGWLANLGDWAGLRALFSVTRCVTTAGKTTEETSYYITSCEPNAEDLLYITRSHWMIESMHWSLDVVFHEDNNGFESNNTQKVLNSLRKLALFAHKLHVSTQPEKNRRSVKQNAFHALLNNNVCLQVLSLIG